MRYGRSMASVNQTWPHRVIQMGKTHSKPLVADRITNEEVFQRVKEERLLLKILNNRRH